jgi:LacI family transcriptional regulator
VICRSWSEPELEILRAELEPFNIPVVLVDGSFPHEWCPRVISDDFTGAKLAVEHLHSLGHRRIAHVTNILTTNGFAKMRHDGYRAALREFGLDCGEELTLMIDSKNIFEDSFISSVESLCVNGGATAVFCGSDPIAMMVYRAASKAGLKIPEELSVAGYANLDYTAMMTPPLTTVAQPFVEMGSRAAEKLIMLIESGEECSGDEFLPVKLVVRESTARHMQRMRV